MNNKIFINLDKEKTIPKLTPFQGLVDIQKNGRLIVKNSVLENIDTMREDELTYILRTLKSYISPVVTSQYIPSIAQFYYTNIYVSATLSILVSSVLKFY